MSIANELQNLKDSFTNYAAKVKAVLAKKPASVTLADSAPTLGGQTPTQMKSTADAYLATHTGNKANPHVVTAAQVNSYLATEIDAMAALDIPAGVLPLSRYGSLDYLPPGVSGNFEGATVVRNPGTGSINNREQFSLQLEANGTLAFLRNGTDGSRYGVYYGYVAGAVDGFVGGKVVTSSKRYQPPFFQSGQSARYLHQGGQGVLSGRVQDSSMAAGDCFIIPVNGSLNDTTHTTGVWLDGATWDAILEKSEIILTPSKIYILYNQYATPGSPSAGDPLDFTLYEIPLSSLGTGTAKVTPTQTTVGQCTGFLGATYNTGLIRLAAVAEAQGNSTPALVQHISGDNGGWWSGARHIGGSGRILTLSVLSPDKTKIRVLCYMNPRYNGLGKGLQPTWLAFSFVINLADMTVTLDAGQTPFTLSPAGDGTITFGGPIYGNQVGQLLGNQTGSDVSVRSYITPNGLIFASRLPYAPASSESVYRGKWNTFTTAYDALQSPFTAAGKVPETRDGLNLTLNFGSALGDSFDGFRLMINNKALVMTRNSSNAYAMASYSLRGPTDALTTNYSYSSITYSPIAGFAPTTDRTNVDPTTTRTALTGVIVHADASTIKSVSGSVLSNLGQLSRPVTINGDLTTTGTVSATQAQLETLRDQIITLAGKTVGNVTGTSAIDLFIPQDPAVPVFAAVSYILNGTDRRFAMALVTPSARTGAIATLTLGALIDDRSLASGVGSTGVTADLLNAYRNLSLGIYETSDSYLIGGGAGGTFNYSGGGILSRFRFGVKKSDGSIFNPGAVTASSAITGARIGVLPGQGLGEFYLIDTGTKLIFRNLAKTAAELTAWTYTVTEQNSIVVAAQEVAQGWIVYFTEVTPVILGGKAYSLPIGSIDLTTIQANPANSTFYLYVNLVDGVATYQITTSYASEDNSSLFVGTIVTGASSINALNIEKVTKFDAFRISSSPRGASIPVTVGLPNQTASLDPTWFP